jgi:hypothetical protein
MIGKFARTLLATTCLTVASSAAALAGTITYTEGTTPAPADFPNTMGSATSLSAATISGTTIVDGHTAGGDVDWFELTGLGTGTFTVTADHTSGAGSDTINVLETAPSTLNIFTSGFDSGESAGSGSIAIPTNGDLFIEVLRNAGTGESSNGYQVTVNTTASSVPEPATIAMVGLGLAGAFALRRKLRKQ